MAGAITKYIDVVFDRDYKQVAPSVYRYDHGIALRIRGVPTDVAWQCHFSCRGNDNSIPSVATTSGDSVIGVIPDVILMQPREVICYLYYEDNNFGRTVYEIFIPVQSRARPANGSYTPQQIDAYDQLVAELQSLIGEVESLNPVEHPTIASDDDDIEFPVTAGQHYWHANTLYRAKSDIPTLENWTPEHWEAAVIGDELTEIQSDLTEVTEYIGHNLWRGDSSITYTGSKTITFNPPLPAGTYTLSAVATSTSSADKIRVLLDYGVTYFSLDNNNSRSSSTVTFGSQIQSLLFRAGTTTELSNGKIATVSDIQIESGSTAHTYEPSILTAIDSVARDAAAEAANGSKMLNDYAMAGGHVIPASEMESGSWAYSSKAENSKRLRNAELYPVRAGMAVRYKNPTMKVDIAVLETKTSGAFIQNSGWISANGSGTYQITVNGYLVFLVQSENDITVSDFDTTAVILESATTGLEQTDKALYAVETLTAKPVAFGWLQNADIWPDYGTDRSDMPTRSRSDYIFLPKGASLTVTPSPWYIQWYRYESPSKSYKDRSSFTASWTNSPFTLKNTDADYYYRFVVRDANASANVNAGAVTVVGAITYPIVSQIAANTANIEALMNPENDDLAAVENMSPLSVNFGWLQSTDIWPTLGTDRDNRPTRSRSGYILLPKNGSLTVTPSPWRIQWYRYDAQTKTYNGKSSFTAEWTADPFTIRNTDADYYYRFVVRAADPDANVTASEITVTGAMNFPIVSQVKTNTTDIAALKSYHAAAFVTPTSLRICGGIEQNFYFQNILKGFDAKRAYQIATSTYATNYVDFARISKSANTSESHGFRFYLWKNNSDGYQMSNALNYQIVPKSSGSGLSKKVLIIGDSLTYNQPLTKHLVDDLLTSDAMTVELIGTLGTAPYKREGRPGWSTYNYAHEASHTNDSGSTFTNAFWNSNTAAFDFSYYMEQNNFSGVDYVFINLGTNDFGRATADIVADLQIMIDSIKAYSSAIRIGVWTPPPRALTGIGSLVNRDTLLGIVSAILTAFEGKESQKIYTVPVTLNVDPYYDFPMSSVNVSARNTAYQMLVATDKVHPADAGYWKMADMIYSYIKYFGYLDAQA